MMTLDQILRSLDDRNLSVVADRLGLSRMTLYRITSGKMKPRYDTLQKLSDYLEGIDQ